MVEVLSSEYREDANVIVVIYREDGDVILNVIDIDINQNPIFLFDADYTLHACNECADDLLEESFISRSQLFIKVKGKANYIVIKLIDMDMSLKDHRGFYHQSIEEMCSFNKVDIDVFKSRRASGMDVEEALVGSFLPVRDHRGVRYENETKMCISHKMDINKYKEKLKRGLDLKDALDWRVK